MKIPFNIPIPVDQPWWCKLLTFIWLFTLRLVGFVVMPVVCFCHGLNFAWEKDSISWFPENFWQCFSHFTRFSWYRLAGYDTAGYYQFYEPNGSCGPYTWFNECPKNPNDGKKWRLSQGF